MQNYKDYLDELFIDKLGYEPSFQVLKKPQFEGSDNLIEVSRDYVSPKGNIAVIVAVCKDRLPYFQKALIKEYKRTYPDAHFLFISNDGKIFDLYNYATSKKLRPISYNEIERNTKLFKEKVQFFNVSNVEGSADLKVQIEKAFETSDRITKKFYDNFKGVHEKLTKAIKGIKDEDDRRWYATTLLNRIMFIFFLQKNYVLQGDTDYLLSKYDQVQWKGGNYYKDFLLQLFFKGFAKKDNDPQKKAFVKEYGEVRYLNGGLFYPNKIELKYSPLITDTVNGIKVSVADGTNPDIQISNSALHEVIKFLNGYTWYLDNRPTKDEKEINPDVLGYIFEKYINQKELGAYYTKEDITEYISKNTIIPFIFDKLRSNGFVAPDPTTMITNNQDIISIVENYIDDCNDYKTLKFLYKDILQPLSVLDPAVGSGAFLFAALNVLLPIYQATFGRLKTFQDKEKDSWLTAFFKKVDGHPQEYFLTKQIILNNLYGVDIVEEGVEICKLRLFLQLASHLADIKSIEPLPDIDFNIYSGNSLVGGLSWNDLLGTYGLKLFTKDGDGFTEEQLKNDIQNLKEAKQLYRRLQAEEDDEKKLKQQKVIVQSLENRINHCIDIGIENPFHWFVEYADIFERGGFNVIIGNPPYVEYSKIKSQYKLKGFVTEGCGNLYANFFERSHRITCRQSYIGLIVPISFSCTKRMEIVQNLVTENTKGIWISHFGERPAKLFEGAEVLLNIVVVNKTGEHIAHFYTTTFNKWKSEERKLLFKNIRFIETRKIRSYVIPKFGVSIEKLIFEKLSKNEAVGNFMQRNSKHFLYYRIGGGRYWKVFSDFQPKFLLNGKSGISSRENYLYFQNEGDKYVCLSALSSSLFYWYFINTTNCRDLNPFDLQSFPLTLANIDKNISTNLVEKAKVLMEDYQLKSQIKQKVSKKTGNISYQEFYPRLSKSILDEIDGHLAKHYGFTDDETNFIINYDSRFRMGDDPE